jgi:hypothetical protein
MTGAAVKREEAGETRPATGQPTMIIAGTNTATIRLGTVDLRFFIMCLKCLSLAICGTKSTAPTPLELGSRRRS